MKNWCLIRQRCANQTENCFDNLYWYNLHISSHREYVKTFPACECSGFGSHDVTLHELNKLSRQEGNSVKLSSFIPQTARRACNNESFFNLAPTAEPVELSVNKSPFQLPPFLNCLIRFFSKECFGAWMPRSGNNLKFNPSQQAHTSKTRLNTCKISKQRVATLLYT